MISPKDPSNRHTARGPGTDDQAGTSPSAAPIEQGPPTSQGVYGIAVASDLVGTGVQNLRAYERAGLVDPSRTAGGNRLYSPDDVARLRRIQRLLAQGLNLAGISLVLDLQDDNRHLREQLADPDHEEPNQSVVVVFVGGGCDLIACAES